LGWVAVLLLVLPIAAIGAGAFVEFFGEGIVEANQILMNNVTVRDNTALHSKITCTVLLWLAREGSTSIASGRGAGEGGGMKIAIDCYLTVVDSFVHLVSLSVVNNSAAHGMLDCTAVIRYNWSNRLLFLCLPRAILVAGHWRRRTGGRLAHPSLQLGRLQEYYVVPCFH
jgi:hypothetical protein